jgi:hypothetical protein
LSYLFHIYLRNTVLMYILTLWGVLLVLSNSVCQSWQFNTFVCILYLISNNSMHSLKTDTLLLFWILQYHTWYSILIFSINQCCWARSLWWASSSKIIVWCGFETNRDFCLNPDQAFKLSGSRS